MKKLSLNLSSFIIIILFSILFISCENVVNLDKATKDERVYKICKKFAEENYLKALDPKEEPQHSDVGIMESYVEYSCSDSSAAINYAVKKNNQNLLFK